MSKFQTFYRRNLPHYQPKGATLFITFRLAGSLPVSLLQTLEEEAERNRKSIARLSNADEQAHLAYVEQKRQFARWDHALDSCQSGPQWLAEPAIAEQMAEALLYRDKSVYNLIAYSIMSNHVHLVCTPLMRTVDEYYALSQIMQSLKGNTALRANKILQRSGAFWQHESYDHVIRDADELERVVAYVLNNPVKAGLVLRWQDWPWSYCHSAS